MSVCETEKPQESKYNLQQINNKRGNKNTAWLVQMSGSQGAKVIVLILIYWPLTSKEFFNPKSISALKKRTHPMNQPTLFIPLLSTAPQGLPCFPTHKCLLEVAEEHPSQQECTVDLWREIWCRAVLFLALPHPFPSALWVVFYWEYTYNRFQALKLISVGYGAQNVSLFKPHS